MSRNEVVATLGLVEAPDSPNPRASIFTLPNEWTILLTLDFDYPTPERMAAVSAGGRAIAVSASDVVMFSVVRGYEDGKAVFAIEHDGEDIGARHIAKAGAIPAEWDAIFDRLSEKQDREDGEEGNGGQVDHLYDAPIELAEALCGYRYDVDWPEGEEKPDIILLVNKKPPSPFDRKGPGLLSRLFGR